eukprot:TRINITY_DN17178_c0_g1_i1.p1 TRINITY_DN17178_c0_g1~~TRINITY_DN17178_c0_g1_i1.p1  ORF type:complete len:186 (+),score=6.68 TRINITY_DN17178_c0_g1_i1:79-636(+)
MPSDSDFDPRAAVAAGEGLREVAWEELRRHSVEGDAWIAVHGRVYDVSAYGDQHPGGAQLIAALAGEDVTADWEGVGHGYGHGRMRLQGEVNASMQRMLVGRTPPGPAPPHRRPAKVWSPTGHEVAPARAAALVAVSCIALAVAYGGTQWVAREFGVGDTALHLALGAVLLAAAHVAGLCLLPQG